MIINYWYSLLVKYLGFSDGVSKRVLLADLFNTLLTKAS